MSRDCESFPLFSTESIREIEVFIIVRYPCEIPDRIVEDSRVKYKCRNVSRLSGGESPRASFKQFKSWRATADKL